MTIDLAWSNLEPVRGIARNQCSSNPIQLQSCEVYRSRFDGVTTSSDDRDWPKITLLPLILLSRLRCAVCWTVQIGGHYVQIDVLNRGISR